MDRGKHGTYNIRIHCGRDLYMLENIKAAKYNHIKLMNDVMSTALEHVSSSQNFCFSMRCDLDGTYEQLELITDDDVRTMFEMNKQFMEIELYVDTGEAVPLIVDQSTRKGKKRSTGWDDDVDWSTSGIRRDKDFRERMERVYRSRRCKSRAYPSASHDPVFVDLTEEPDSDAEGVTEAQQAPVTETQTAPPTEPQDKISDPIPASPSPIPSTIPTPIPSPIYWIICIYLICLCLYDSELGWCKRW